MKDTNNLKKALLNTLKDKNYKDLIDLILGYIRIIIRNEYIDNNEKVDNLISDLQPYIFLLIGKTIKSLGHSTHIVKFCLNNYFKKGSEFTTDEFYEICNEKLHYFNREDYTKRLGNEIKKGKLERIKNEDGVFERGKYRRV